MPELRDILRTGDVREIWTDIFGFSPWTDPMYDGNILKIEAGIVGPDTPSVTTVEMPAGVVMNAFTVVFSDGIQAYPANNTNLVEAEKVVGITLEDATAGDPVVIATDGVVVNPAWSFSEGPVYVGIDGSLEETPPEAPAAAYLLKFGTVSLPTELTVDLDRAIILVEETP